MATKGIILAGGSGTRLYPLTNVVSKQLLPVYDKPMIYYPLSILMLAGIRDILIITTPVDKDRFYQVLGDGSKFGINITYVIQNYPSGLPEAFILGEKFIANDNVCLILGDNIFYGDSFVNTHLVSNLDTGVATIFGYYVNDPERYGVVEFDESNCVISIEEKPVNSKSNYAITGLYIFNNDVVDIAKSLKPSKRGETEIVDIINHYRTNNNLKVELLGRGIAWLDTGTHNSLLEASNFISVIEKRQGLKVACLEEIAYIKDFINSEELMKLAEPLMKSEYGQYLVRLVKK